MKQDEIKRVLYVLHSSAVGGMETLCANTAAELVRRGIEVAAAFPADAVFDPLEAKFKAGGATVLRLDTDHLRTSRWTQIRNLARYVGFCRGWRPDVIHLHTGAAAGGAAVVVLSRLFTGATVVCTEHEVMTGERPTLRTLSIHHYHWFMRVLLDKLCHAIVAVSRRNANLRKVWLDPGRGKFAVSLNGVPIEEITDDARQAQRKRVRDLLNIDSDAIVIGTLCRLASNKGLDDLIAAFTQVRSQQDCELVLVGDGPLRHELEALAERLGVSDGVHFAGYHEDAKAFLSAFDLFVLAVPAGSMSIALLEAMCKGLPCVITFCGPEEAVVPEKTGLCAPPNDPARLAVSLLRLASEPQLRSALGAAAAAHVRRFYSIQRVADDWLEIYRTCRTGVPQRLWPDSPPYPGPLAISPAGPVLSPSGIGHAGSGGDGD